MKKFCMLRSYFSRGEQALWCGSAAVILLAFAVFDRENWLALGASLIGVTSLIFNARGNPVGQALMVVFSLLYGMISWSFRYYGEMVTYLGMTMPMAAVALMTWLKNPYEGNRAEVVVDRVGGREVWLMWGLTAAVTAFFGAVLAYFQTANLFLSTLSVSTSFLAVYLTFRRDPSYAVAYAANDVILIALWLLAAAEDRGYLSVAICFAAFLANDIYGFFSWQAMAARQTAKI